MENEVYVDIHVCPTRGYSLNFYNYNFRFYIEDNTTLEEFLSKMNEALKLSIKDNHKN